MALEEARDAHLPSLVVYLRSNKKRVVQVKAVRTLIHWFIRGSTIRAASPDDINGKVDAAIFCAFNFSSADGCRAFTAVTDDGQAFGSDSLA